ncbi:MAG: lipid A biosynthesis lauroyl acyltransferase [Acetobacteraceae bacterium]|nr:lipid A biosynthesis lauroyl acyltransferase [Acetobacteraceae bacterium]MCX7685412.1 lipid A biosynthesis lauroyl acyltransferase [Acetobacteraceae bacterium]MDW8398497.1 lipid A biosynthesis lauroyl acyltransferase [Acetobacteraceae bacterium]
MRLLRMKLRLLRLAEEALALLVRGGFALLRALGPDRSAALGGLVARGLGPLFPAHRIARENIARAFPEKPPAERAAILRQAWDNLGRTACEYPHLDTIWDWGRAPPGQGRVEFSAGSAAVFDRLRDDGKPALIFAAHLGNWELPALAARAHGLEAAVLYRTPNNRRIARDILALRRGAMGEMIPAGIEAPLRLVRALERGAHVGMLVDQRFGRGPRVMFFGHPATANPLLAELAARFDCPVHGTRCIRLPGNRFRLELTEEIPLPRDAAGRVDVAAATAAITAVVEGWIREHPGQWLWMHRRWRS